MNNISCCHIPTRLILVDDDSRFLNSVTMNLSRRKAMVTFENPEEAILFLQAIDALPNLFSKVTTYDKEPLRGKEQHLQFDINRLHRIIYDEQCFEALSKEIIPHLAKDSHHPLKGFHDKAFKDFITREFKKYDIVEYYLYDERGSLLALDFQGKPLIIAIRDEDDMQSAAEIAALCDEAVSADILNATEHKEKLLFTGHANDFAIPPSQWHSYLWPIHFSSELGYFVAVIPNPPIAIDANQLVSFSDYLEKFYGL